MDRIYMNRIPGQERIHVEIDAGEISDLLDDLKETPDDFAATRQLLKILRAAEHAISPTIAENRPTAISPSEAHPPIKEWEVEVFAFDGWLNVSESTDLRDQAIADRAAAEAANPAAEHRIVRKDTRWTVELATRAPRVNDRSSKANGSNAERPPSLAAPCAACPHPYNWHTPRKRCQAMVGDKKCGCLAFAVPAPEQPLSDEYRYCGATVDELDGSVYTCNRRVGHRGTPHSPNHDPS